MAGDLPPPRLVRQPLKIEYLGAKPSPPPPLDGDGLMHPIGTTLLYGPGGIGKGWVACYLIRALHEEEYNPLILDFEGVRHEWMMRLNWMGVETVPYHAAEGPLTPSMVVGIRDVIEDRRITHIVIDSASAAKQRTAEADSGGQDVTIGMFRLLRSLTVPVFMIAHEGKTGTTPIGSTHFTTQSRLVWRAAGVANGTELRMTKVNDRELDEQPAIFTRVRRPDGIINVIRGWLLPEKPETKIENLADAVMRVMVDEKRSMSAEAIQKILVIEGREVTLSSIATMMRKLLMQGRLQRIGRGKYSVKVETVPYRTT